MALRYFLFFVALQAVLVSSELTCYFCNTEIHGQGCQDPIDTEQIQVQRCSDSEIVIPTENSYISTVWDFVKAHTGHKSVDVRDGTDQVCISMTYEFDHRNVSARGCETASRMIVTEPLEICEYYRQLVPARVANLNCTVCTENLCNHVNFEGEGDNSGDGNGSQAVQVSVKMVLGLVLAKVLIV